MKSYLTVRIELDTKLWKLNLSHEWKIIWKKSWIIGNNFCFVDWSVTLRKISHVPYDDNGTLCSRMAMARLSLLCSSWVDIVIVICRAIGSWKWVRGGLASSPTRLLKVNRNMLFAGWCCCCPTKNRGSHRGASAAVIWTRAHCNLRSEPHDQRV